MGRTPSAAKVRSRKGKENAGKKVHHAGKRESDQHSGVAWNLSSPERISMPPDRLITEGRSPRSSPPRGAQASHLKIVPDLFLLPLPPYPSPAPPASPLPVAQAHKALDTLCASTFSQPFDAASAATRLRRKRALHEAIHALVSPINCEIFGVVGFEISARYDDGQSISVSKELDQHMDFYISSRDAHANGIPLSLGEYDLAVLRILAWADLHHCSQTAVTDLITSVDFLNATLSPYSVRDARQKLNADLMRDLGCVPIPGVVGQAFNPLRVMEYLIEKGVIRESDKVDLLLSGDGMVQGKQSAVQLCLRVQALQELAKARGIPATHAVILLAFVKGAETSETVGAIVAHLGNDLQALRVKYPNVRALVCTDLKMLNSLMGHMSCSASYACLLCNQPLNEKSKYIASPEQDAELAREPISVPSIPSPSDSHLSRNTHPGAQSTLLGRFIGLEGIVVDVLHYKLRVCEKLHREYLHVFTGVLAVSAKYAKRDEAIAMAKSKLKTVGIFPGLVDLEKDAKKKMRGHVADAYIANYGTLVDIITDIAGKRDGAQVYVLRVSELQKLLVEFLFLLGFASSGNGHWHDKWDDDGAVEEFERRARAFEIDLANYTGVHAVPLYVHYFAHHVPVMLRNLGPLGRLSCELTESFNLELQRRRRVAQCGPNEALSQMQISARTLHVVTSDDVYPIAAGAKRAKRMLPVSRENSRNAIAKGNGYSQSVADENFCG